MIFALSVLIFAISFLFPIGLYPFQDSGRDFFAFLAAFLLFISVLKVKSLEFGVSRSIIFLLVLLVLLSVSFYVLRPVIVISYNHYLLAIIFISMLSISISTLVYRLSVDLVLDFVFTVIFWVSFISVVLGLLRFYGVLKELLPVILNDGDRLLGPLGQPNLHALVSSFGVLSLVYFRFVKVSIKGWLFWSLVLVFFYSGALTASRAWIVYILIISSSVLIYFFKSSDLNKRFLKELTISPFLFLIIMVSFYWVAPKLDSAFSAPLIESGYINRVSFEKVQTRRIDAGSSGRLAEWEKAVLGFSDIDNLWIGHGLGRYGEFSNRQELKNNLAGNGGFWGHSHNIFIMFLIEWGVLGLIYTVFLFLYFGFVFYQSIFSVSGKREYVFPLSIVAVMLAHSLVEFSLWYFPFLAVFVVFFTAIDRVYSIKISSYFFSRAVIFVFCFVFFPFGIYVAKDAYSVVKIMFDDTSDFSDVWELGYVSNSSIVGDKALMVSILRFPPMISGGERSLKQLGEFADWRPHPLFLLREASLSALNIGYEDACHKIIDSIKLYPDIIAPLQREIRLLIDSKEVGGNNDVYFNDCIMKGVNYWIRNGRTKGSLLGSGD